MKKLIMTLFMALLLIGLVGCGSDSSSTDTKQETTSQPVEEVTMTAADFNGSWVQQGATDETRLQEGVISDGRIELYWVDEEGSDSIYWIGTFDVPEDLSDGDVIVSQRNAEETDNAILASTEDTKEFTYKKGVLSYPMSFSGLNMTIKLEKAE